jgi:hypothetical protein
MKNIILLGIILVLGFTSCNKCRNEDPRARVVNNGTESVSVHIETSGGNTININNIEAGQTSNFGSYAPGLVYFRITVGNGNNSTDYESTVSMEECFEYDIILDKNNNITSVPTDRND